MAQLDLIGDDGEELGAGIAPAFPAPTRTGKAGRPPGSVNRKTLALRQLYQARGHRDPVAWMGDMITADPVELWHWFRDRHLERHVEGAPTLLEVVELQRKVAADLAPYLHGKMPAADDGAGDRLPVLIVHTDANAVERRRQASGVLSIGAPVEDPGPGGEAEQDQGLTHD